MAWVIKQVVAHSHNKNKQEQISVQAFKSTLQQQCVC